MTGGSRHINHRFVMTDRLNHWLISTEHCMDTVYCPSGCISRDRSFCCLLSDVGGCKDVTYICLLFLLKFVLQDPINCVPWITCLFNRTDLIILLKINVKVLGLIKDFPLSIVCEKSLIHSSAMSEWNALWELPLLLADWDVNYLACKTPVPAALLNGGETWGGRGCFWVLYFL